MKFRVVFKIGVSNLSVLRTARDSMDAYREAEKEKIEIQKEELSIVQLVSVTQLK